MLPNEMNVHLHDGKCLAMHEMRRGTLFQFCVLRLDPDILGQHSPEMLTVSNATLACSLFEFEHVSIIRRLASNSGRSNYKGVVA